MSANSTIRKEPGFLPDPSDLVLVAFLPSPRDMEIARVLGWYRIPIRSAPKVIAVDQIAFYQPATFGPNRWRIEFVAACRGHELSTRIDLLHDEGQHPQAQEEYYRIKLGPLVRLPRPILAENWKRITFFYTTGAHLIQARTVKDLVVEADERALLWRSLRERAVSVNPYLAKNLPELELAPEVILEVLGVAALMERKEPTRHDSGSSRPDILDEADEDGRSKPAQGGRRDPHAA